MAHYTNIHNLPLPLFRALIKDTYRGDPSTISVTALINHPRIVQLTKRHDDEITKDASDNLYSLLGSAVHYVNEHASGQGDIAEVRLRMQMKGAIVSGMTDLYTQAAAHVQDYKITGTYSFLLEGKNYAVINNSGMIEDAGPWTAQVNLNAMLYRNAGFPVEKGSIVAILRDWNRNKAKQDRNYPQAAFYVLDIPIWTQEQCIDYAQRRINYHISQRKLGDKNLDVCSEKDRWHRGEQFAVMKEGNKKATKVGETMPEAEGKMAVLVKAHDDYEQEKFDARKKEQVVKPKLKDYVKKQSPKYEIVHRPGINMRCESFCDAAPFCDFAKTLTPSENEEE